MGKLTKAIKMVPLTENANIVNRAMSIRRKYRLEFRPYPASKIPAIILNNQISLYSRNKTRTQSRYSKSKIVIGANQLKNRKLVSGIYE